MYCDWPELGRCCFCMPLRKGILIIAYINIFYNAFMIGVYSYSVHINIGVDLPNYGSWANLPAELSLSFYCIEFLFNSLLIYGAHKKAMVYLKTYYFFAITTTVAAVLLTILEVSLGINAWSALYYIDLCFFSFAGLCIQLYLITLIRSLLKRLERSGPHVYENQLHEFVSGETKIESNGIYNNSTVTPIEV